MTPDDKAKLAKAGVSVFRRLMDRFAAHPVTKLKLVRRFRTFFGLETEEDVRRAHEEMMRNVQRAVDEYKASADKTPAQRPSSKK